jgi:SAM-dependent methyltransferase
VPTDSQKQPPSSKTKRNSFNSNKASVILVFSFKYQIQFMDSNQLTDKAFWLDYWENKTGLVFNIPDNYPFLSLLKKLVTEGNVKSLLEIGGFPGYYSVWTKKHLGIDSTLLDFVIHPRILHQLEVANALPSGETKTLEADLFNYEPREKFDLVMSNGLIEHFANTQEIIEKHTAFLAKNGVLFISLPNFRGLNGWFQKTFDPENYAKHNIKCMDLDLLENACRQLGLKDIKVYYSGRFMLWLENERKQPAWVRLFRKATWFVLKVFSKFFPFETKALSPYIVITARV